MQGNIDQPLRVGCENQQRDEYMSAELQYKLVLQKQPKNAAANHLMGLLKFKQGLFDQAVPFLKLALEIKPEEAQNWISYIDVLIKLKAIKDAQNMLDQAKEKGAKGKVFENLQEKIKQSNQANRIEGFEYEKPIEVERNFPVHDNVLCCVYDMHVSPCSFDFFTFIYSCELARKRRGLAEINLFIIRAKMGKFRRDMIRTSEQNETFFNNVIIPGISLLETCTKFSWCSREEVDWLNHVESKLIFPRGYSTYDPVHEYLGSDLVAAKIRGDAPVSLKAPKYAVTLAKKFHDNIGNKKYVTLTAREINRDDVNGGRKIKKDVWKQAFKTLESLDIVPIILRDTSAVFSKPLFDDVLQLFMKTHF